MSTGILSIGISGIRAAQLGLEATQHNIANANTAGYSRQYIQQSAGVPLLTGSGIFGTGTSVDTVRRAYDQVLTSQVFSAQAGASQSDAYLAKISQIDNMLGDTSSGLSSALQSFFTGVQAVSANPSLVSARQSMISSAQALATRFNNMGNRLDELYAGVNSEITSEVATINEYVQQIASLNVQITKAEAATNQPANDLLDARDQVVSELNKHVRVQTAEDSQGNFSVFVGNGQQLVVGGFANSLITMNSSVDPERVTVGLRMASGTTMELSEKQFDGGSIGGLMGFRSGSLDSASNALGQIAASLALTFNAQHALGQDLDGLAQGDTGFEADFFSVSGPTVLATSDTAAIVTASFLAPSLSSNGNFYTNLTGSNYLLKGDASGVSLTRSSDGKSWSATDIASLNALITGEGFSLGGAAPTAGVSYVIKPTADVATSVQLNASIASDPRRIAAADASAGAGAVSDNRNAVKLAALQTQGTMLGSKASFQTVYASLVSEVGTKTSQMQLNSDAQTALLTQAESARASVSGVNLDEEAANLLRYQQAYQASAKSLEVASKLFDTILNL